jgi:hypothetical protein
MRTSIQKASLIIDLLNHNEAKAAMYDVLISNPLERN